MSMSDDLARAAKAHQWWTKKEALGLADYILDGLADTPDTARLEAWAGVREDGTPVLWFKVAGRDPSAESHEGYDASHPCPPFCGGS